MYIVDYEKIAIEIDPELLVHREDDFVYLLYPNPPRNSKATMEWGNMTEPSSVPIVMRFFSFPKISRGAFLNVSAKNQ